MPVPIVSICWELTIVCVTPTTLKPLTTKIQCDTIFIYSTCNQIKTSSSSSLYSRYYELVYLSVCILVVFSDRAFTVVLQKIIINTFYDIILQWNLCGDFKANFSIGFILFLYNTTFRFLCRSEAEFVVVYVKTVTRDHSNAIS